MSSRAVGQAAVPSPDDSAPPPPAGLSASSPEIQARHHFEKAIADYQAESFESALAEFRASFELHPTLSALTNASLCLRRLGQFEEALDLLEIVPQRFVLSPDEQKDHAAAVAELSRRLGVVELRGLSPGSHIHVDGRERGIAPLAKPLRLTSGRHRLLVERDGSPPAEMTLEVAGGQIDVVDVPASAATGSFASTPESAKTNAGTRAPSGEASLIVLGVELGALWSPTLGGSIGGCSGSCDAGSAWGGRVVGKVGYGIAPGWVLSLDAGYLSLREKVENRRLALNAVGKVVDGVASDSVLGKGAMLGVSLAYQPGVSFAPQIRVGAGSFFGNVNDTRAAELTSVASPGPPARGPLTYVVAQRESQSAAYAYVQLGAMVGFRPAPHLELTAGLDAMIMVALRRPEWQRANFNGPDGVSWFASERLTASVIVALCPLLGLRYSF